MQQSDMHRGHMEDAHRQYIKYVHGDMYVCYLLTEINHNEHCQPLYCFLNCVNYILINTLRHNVRFYWKCFRIASQQNNRKRFYFESGAEFVADPLTA